MRTQYDAIVVLGSKPDTTTWEFPSHVITSLDQAIKLWRQDVAPYIVVSGKWALSFEYDGIQQPYRECDKMADYLIYHNIPANAILREGDSKDTISNLYYIKRHILCPKQIRNLLFIVADFRQKRLAYLANKVLGSGYSIDIQTVPCLPNEVYTNESDALVRTQNFLHEMTDGDDSYLDDKFYKPPYYQT